MYVRKPSDLRHALSNQGTYRNLERNGKVDRVKGMYRTNPQRHPRKKETMCALSLLRFTSLPLSPGLVWQARLPFQTL